MNSYQPPHARAQASRQAKVTLKARPGNPTSFSYSSQAFDRTAPGPYNNHNWSEASVEAETVFLRECEGVKSERLSRKSNIRKISRALVCEELTVFPAKATYDLIEADRGMAMADIRALDIKRYSNLDAAPYAFDTQDDVLGWIAALSTESPVAGALFKFAASAGWRVKLADLSTGGFHLDIPGRTLHLDHAGMDASALGRSMHFRCAILQSFIRGLRDIWQEEKLGGIETVYRPDSFLMMERIRAADVDSVAVLAAYELRAAGYGDLWRHILGGDDGDLAVTFGCALEKTPASLYNGAALARTFSQWFEDELRVDAVDHDALEHLDDLLENGASAEALGKDIASAAQAESLSTLPDGAQYLTGMGDNVLRDPLYAGLHDEINQAHLFHIVYDTQVVMVGGVPFGDAKLARKIFPGVTPERISLKKL